MAQKTKKEILHTLGNSGTEYFSGYFTEEYNAEWRDTRRVELVEKMRRGDGTVSAMLQAIKTPIKATTFYIEPADSDKKNEEIASFVEDQLFNMPGRSFQEFLRELLSYLDFGHYCFEKIWYIDKNGNIGLKDLAPRIPHSIMRWQTDDNQKGITQYVKNDSLYDENDKRSTTYSIPLDKLVVFTHQKEGDDMTGVSILRASYQHWYYKTNLYKIQSIAIERLGVGIPEAITSNETSDDEKDAMETALENLYTNEQAYLLHHENIKFDIKSPTGTGVQQAIDTAIKHHNRMMLLSILAEFLDLGGGETGSFALSQDQSSFFLQHLEDIAKQICETINRQIIRPIVDLNFTNVEYYPELKFNPIGSIDYSEMSKVFSELAKAGLLHADPEMYQFIRTLFKFPRIADAELEKIEVEEIDKEIKDIEEEMS